MSENIKVRWLTDHEQTKIAPKTLSTQIMNEDGTHFKDTVESAIVNAEAQTTAHASNNDIHVTAEEKEAWNSIEVPSLDGYATQEYVDSLVKKLSATLVLSFYCIEDVTVITNGIPKVYPANSNVEIVFTDEDVFEIVPTSDKSILALTAFPGTLGTFYPWLEGVAQFSNILFDMNDVDMYSKWSQGNQGAYHVQKAQYTNCIFWSDNPYINDVSKRTNYTLTHTSQLPLCYSTIPDNTFKAFYLAFGVNSDPNWGNDLYKDSFAKATWATQVFSYYGARTIGIVGHDDPDFNIVLPKDCRGLMFDARHIENAGTFDAINVTNFGAKSGSWREAFGFCPSLKRLYIKNLKVSLNISWSPIDYDSISYIISAAANTNAITISVSPYTYNLLSSADFTAAANKNITIALITTNYVEDRRLNTIADKADKDHTHTEYMSATNPVGTGSFSMNRKAGTTVGDCSSTFGINCTASGTHSHAEGYGTTAYGNYSHAEGYSTTASANYSHAEGYLTKASGTYSHAEGSSTIASGGYSHVEGRGTKASAYYSHVQGQYNIADTTSAHIVGNGSADDARSNAHTLDWDGNAWYAGDVYVGSTSGTNKDEGSEKLAKISDVPVNVSQLANDSGYITEAPQSDLTQNDPTQPDYVKNRTHWIENIELVQEITVELDADGIGFFTPVFDIVPGNSYTVTFNGEQMECVTAEDSGIVFITNQDAANQLIVAPGVAFGNDTSMTLGSPANASSTVTISIESNIVHKLDKEYLPVDEIPLSAFENDLYYTAKREEFITLTASDFVFNEDLSGYEYVDSPKLDWLTSADVIGFELVMGENTFTEETVTPTYEALTDDGTASVVSFITDTFMLVNAFDALTETVVNNFSVVLMIDETTLNGITSITLYRKTPEKKIPADVVDIEIPTKVSELINNSGFITAAEIPTKVSELINNSGFITAAEIPASLPNPNALTFTGAVTGTYDGSSAKTVNIPEEIDRNFLVMLLNDMALGLDISNKLNSFREAMNVQKHGVIKEDDGHSYCYVNGTVQTVEGLTWYGKSHLIYIGASDNGALAAGEYTLSEDKCLPYGFTHGACHFGNDGRYYTAFGVETPCQYFAPETVSEIVEIDSILYYYENGVCKQNAGLVQLIDETNRPYYIYVKPNGQLATGVYWPTTRIIPAGTYNFGNNGVLPICNVCYKFTNVISDYDYLAVVKNNGVMMTLTPTSGQAISSVVVTMGGVDVTSSVYSDGVINISDVIGDIVVTATAE